MRTDYSSETLLRFPAPTGHSDNLLSHPRAPHTCGVCACVQAKLSDTYNIIIYLLKVSSDLWVEIQSMKGFHICHFLLFTLIYF